MAAPRRRCGIFPVHHKTSSHPPPRYGLTGPAAVHLINLVHLTGQAVIKEIRPAIEAWAIRMSSLAGPFTPFAGRIPGGGGGGALGTLDRDGAGQAAGRVFEAAGA